MSRRPVVLAAVLVAWVLGAVLVPSRPAVAHGGGLDRYGCHNDRKAGTYHCHRGPCQGRTSSLNRR